MVRRYTNSENDFDDYEERENEYLRDFESEPDEEESDDYDSEDEGNEDEQSDDDIDDTFDQEKRAAYEWLGEMHNETDIQLSKPYMELLQMSKCFRLLTREQEIQLIKQARGLDDKDSWERLVMSNLRFIYQKSREYKGEMPIDDAFMAGINAFIEAISKFVFEKGTRLNTYAGWWIRQSVQRAAIAETDGRTRVPVYLNDLHCKVIKVKNALTVELNREPTKEEIAEAANLSVKDVKKGLNLPPNTVSLATLVGENGDSTLEDFIPSEDESPEEPLERDEISDYIMRSLDGLPSRSATVLRYVFGLFGVEKLKSNEEIAQKLNITKERVRQITNSSLDKLRAERGEALRRYCVDNNIVVGLKYFDEKKDEIIEAKVIEHIQNGLIDIEPHDRFIAAAYYGVSSSLTKTPVERIAEINNTDVDAIFCVVDRVEKQLINADPFLRRYFLGEEMELSEL